MKIRIKGNSVRIRLTRPEVEKFGADGYLEDSTNFTSSTLTYILERSSKFQELSADMKDGRITMYVPDHLVSIWVSSDEVGFSNHINTPGGSLFLLLEKDFKCADADVLEDQSDNYEHPTKTC